ncbi:MAG: acetate--CoA ligase family protein [Spirochaetota bacterium]
MVHEKLKYLFRPASIAVVGASEKPGPGLQVIENLRALGYEGDIYPVNPKYENVLGLTCYPSLSAVKAAGHSVDTVAILLGKQNVIPVMEEAATIGAKAGWAFAAGFGETGDEGKGLEKQLLDLCKDNDMLFLGPNCVGYLNPNDKSGTFSAPAPKEIRAGNIGMVAQSGYLGLAVANSNRGIGFSLLCTTGNEVVVDATDCMAYMLEDEGTDVVLAFIEQFRTPAKLVKVAKRARELQKPIVLIKVGKSAMAQRATVAHTGALAGSDDVQDALFEKLGIIRVNDFDEMFETAELLARTKQRLPKSNRVFGITLSGGVISLMGDLSDSLDISFPKWSRGGEAELRTLLPDFSGVANPLDAWGSGKIEQTYEQCIEIASREPESDLLLVVQDVPGGMSPRQVEQYKVVARAAVKVAGQTDKPVVMLSNQSSGFNDEIQEIMAEGGVPLLQGTREGLLAVNNLIRYAEFLRKPAPDFEVEPNKAAHALLPDGAVVLNEYDSKRLVAEYGVPVTEEFLCGSKEEAQRKAEEFGYPVVLKLISNDIQHKTEAGVVKLKLKDREAVGKAYDEVVANAKAYKPDAEVQGVLCYKMVEEPVAEAIVGVLSDPYFGPAVVFGLGGIMVEVIRDRALLIPPISREEAREAIDSTKGSKLLYGFRGKPKADVEALVDVIVKAGEMTADLSERIDALDVNPLLILPEGKGVVAVDALVALKEKK